MGGSTDMFISYNLDNKLVYGYNKNSLYPSVIQNKNLPMCKPIYFKRNIRKYNSEAYGFFITRKYLSYDKKL